MKVVQLRHVIAIGFGIMMLGLCYSNTLTPSIDFRTLAIMRCVQSAALGFLFVPISIMSYHSMPKSLSADAAALFVMLRNVFGSIGISACTALVSERMQARQAHLSTWLTPFNKSFNELVARNEAALRSLGWAANTLHDEAVSLVFNNLKLQSAVLAYADVFIYGAALAAAMIPLALLLSPVKDSGKKSMPMH
jgi:DHA2 family multidrug resistance protein